MAQTPNPEIGPLDRENLPAIHQSVSQQWVALRHLLHLPPIEDLPNENERSIAERIANFVNQSRGGIININNFRDTILQDYRNELAMTSNAAPAMSAARRGIDRAEAWNRVLYKHISEEDIRALINRLPAAIRLADGSRTWSGRIVIGPNTFSFTIDLDHPVWRSGNVEQIRARLIDNNPAEVGVNFTSLGGVVPFANLDAPLVDRILESSTEVINPRMPVSDVRLTINNQTVFVNVPELLRRRPSEASRSNQTELINFLTNTPEGTREFLECIQALDPDGTRSLTRPTPREVVTALFRHYNRPPNQPFAMVRSELSRAIEQRQPIENLLAGTADSRELMLALATIQRDPRAAEVLNVAGAEAAKLRTNLQANNINLNAAKALQMLKEIGPPKWNDADVGHGQQAISKISQYLAAGASGPNGSNVNLLTGEITDFTGLQITPPQPNPVSTFPREVAMANAARMPLSMTRIVTTNVRTGAVERDNNEQYQKAAEQGQKFIERLEEEDAKIHKIEDALNAMGTLLHAQEITPAQLAAYPLLNLYLNIVPPGPYTVNRANIDTHMNMSQVDHELRRALMQANPVKSMSLQKVEYYEKKDEDLAKKLDELTSKPNTLAGSEACWAVIRRELENQGIRGKELENALEYKRAQIQRTPESVRDLQSLAASEFPYTGDHDEHARDHYNKEHSYHSLMEWGLRPDIYNEKLRHLFTREGIGLSLRGEEPRSRAFPLSHLIDAYFRTKYVMKLPHSDPRHVPPSHEVISFMRKLHEAILDRGQESLQYASGMSTAELQQMRSAGLEIDPKDLPSMTMTDRMQALQQFLHDDTNYIQKNEEAIKQIIDRAYLPIKEQKERHDFWKDYWNPFGKVNAIKPLSWPKAILVPMWKRGGLPTTRYLWKHKADIAIGGLAGAAVGSFFIAPLGTALGAVAGPFAYNRIFKSAGHASHP